MLAKYERNHRSGEFGDGDTSHRYLDLPHENGLGTEH